MDKISEQRMHQRLTALLPVDIRQLAFQMNTQAQCRDISASGAGVIAGEKITPNTRIEILLEIPSGEAPMRSLGRVVWTEQLQQRSWRMGLQFDQADVMLIQRIFGKGGELYLEK